ncbi:19.8 kDa small heat shock protein [Operophtera brumata]|uniref:19.8 kDa small heat shock protein n=1 Tax=Operophtera brumata TaxID=104452 RepID=A0A0L7LSA1_OPEBR|nr:19.8 kDa small heat shock protein [Operophtera brumata]
MLELPAIYRPTVFGDELILKSIDWLENVPWGKDNSVLEQKDKYEVSINVKDFTPEEIQVNTSDGLLIVEAKHDEKKDDFGYISRHFVRKYHLPEGCIHEEVQSRLSPEGVLVVTAPRKAVVKQDTIIPVSHVVKKKCTSKL